MTEENPGGSPEAENKSSPPISVEVEPEPELSEEDLDKVLAEEDPQFAASLKSLAQDKSLSIANIDMEARDLAFAQEVEKWEKAGKLGKALYKRFPRLPYLSFRWSQFKFYVFSKLVASWVHIKNFLVFIFNAGIKAGFARSKKLLSDFFHFTSEAMRNFKYLPKRKKLQFAGSAALFVFTLAFVYRSVTRGVIPQEHGLFLTSLESVADDINTYDLKDVEPFYENLRTSSSMLMINKMVVNIRKSPNSGNNPMAAFEFMVEGASPEVIIEVKDRETEMRDLMQRTLEDMTFDIVSSPDGKEYMCEELKKEMNRRLTTGKIKKVYIKTAIIKP